MGNCCDNKGDKNQGSDPTNIDKRKSSTKSNPLNTTKESTNQVK